MAESNQFLAFDLGAESGRGVIVTLAGGQVRMEEIHRWPNRPVRMAGTLYWDLPFLFGEMIETMRLCAERKILVDAIGVDTWGVDFGLLDERGKLLGLPVGYRDSRTENIHAYSTGKMSNEEIYALTGYEPWPISSLFQLLSMQRDGSPLLSGADSMLNMPDLLVYLLTGEKANELSIINTSNLLGTDKQWCRKIIDTFLLPDLTNRLIEPGTVVAPLQPEIAEATGLGQVPVVAVCGHDTSAALAAVPAEGEKWAFLSCGTWSILGTLTDQPVATPEALEAGFTNEYTFGGWYLARNIIGLWLVQELRRQWDRSDDPWDYPRMTQEAANCTFEGVLDVADESLMAPDDMEGALRDLLTRSGQPQPDSRGKLVRCVLQSLALEYAWRMDRLAELTGKQADALYMVGGGIANTLLCQFTADACGRSVYAGAGECTALGNALIQAAGLGVVADGAEIRRIMKNSVEVATFSPRESDVWQQRRETYENIRTP